MTRKIITKSTTSKQQQTLKWPLRIQMLYENKTYITYIYDTDNICGGLLGTVLFNNIMLMKLKKHPHTVNETWNIICASLCPRLQCTIHEHEPICQVVYVLVVEDRLHYITAFTESSQSHIRRKRALARLGSAANEFNRISNAQTQVYEASQHIFIVHIVLLIIRATTPSQEM